MQLKSTIIVAACALSMQANAQGWMQDSVDMNPAYAKDVFYSLKNSTVKQEDGSNWHLGFQMTKFGQSSFNATIRANHIKGKVEVYSIHKQASTSFETLMAADTVGLTLDTLQLLNIDTSWGEGAFTQNRSTNQIDFGWGMYQGSPTHSLKGDSIYIVEVNNVPYKLWLKEYISMGGDTLIGYKFRIAGLDGSSDDSFYVKREEYKNSLFAYYNIATKTFANREPAVGTWDLLFTQYAKGLIFGQGGALQSYTGVLTNQGVKVAEVTGVDPDTMNLGSYENYIAGMSTKINEIGDDWKTYDYQNNVYIINDTLKSWIIKAANTQEYYQIKFIRFDGTTTGKIVFAKRFLAVTSIKELVSNISTYSIAPNPANNNISIMIDAKDKVAAARVLITDMTGKMVYHTSAQINKGLNAYSINTATFAPGTYIVTLTNGSWKASEKLVVQH